MMRKRQLFADDDGDVLADNAGHILVVGSSGTGKTQGLIALARAKSHDHRWGFHAIDPDGEISPACNEYVLNPANGLSSRTVHNLRPASSVSFALPMLHVPDRAPQLCHGVSLRALTIFGQAIDFGTGDYGPRLSKLFYMGCLGLSLAGRPLIDLPELFTRDARHLRELIGSGFPFPFVRDEWQSFDALSDRAFLEYRDPLMSRMMPVFANARLRRVFGPQPPLDVAKILARREIVLLDLSGLEHKDAVLIGKSYLSILYHEALQRPANEAPHACVMIDEVFDFMTVDLARGFDRLRKRNMQLVIAIQRLGQLQ